MSTKRFKKSVFDVIYVQKRLLSVLYNYFLRYALPQKVSGKVLNSDTRFSTEVFTII